MVLQEQTLTVDDFWEQYGGKPYELNNGKVIEVSPTSYLHGSIARRIAAILGVHVDAKKLGDVVGAETGFILSETNLRGADAAFISNNKLAQITEPDKYLPFAPDIAVEVVSPTDRAADIKAKVSLYLKAGTQLVWVIYPDEQSVVVHYPDNTAKTLTEADTLDGGTILPDFSVPVSTLFPPELPDTDS